MPWEQAIRVRFGRRVKLLTAGVHLKIPLVDIVYLQSVRLRIAALPRQAVSTSDGHVVTVIGSIGYSIADIRLLYETLHHAEDTISNLAQAAIAEHISDRKLADCSLRSVSTVRIENLGQYGIASVEIYVTEFAVVRAYRLLGDYANYAWGSQLATDQMHNRSK